MGPLAAVFFIMANAYYPARVIARKYIPRSREVEVFFKNYLKIHILFNLMGLLAALLHGHFADESNILLQFSILVTIWLTIIGMLMYYRIPKVSGKQLRLLHTQQFMFLVWIALIIVGHMTL